MFPKCGVAGVYPALINFLLSQRPGVLEILSRRLAVQLRELRAITNSLHHAGVQVRVGPLQRVNPLVEHQSLHVPLETLAAPRPGPVSVFPLVEVLSRNPDVSGGRVQHGGGVQRSLALGVHNADLDAQVFSSFDNPFLRPPLG